MHLYSYRCSVPVYLLSIMSTNTKLRIKKKTCKAILQIIIIYYLIIREVLFSNEVWVNAATLHGTVQEFVMALYPTVMVVV